MYRPFQYSYSQLSTHVGDHFGSLCQRNPKYVPCPVGTWELLEGWLDLQLPSSQISQGLLLALGTVLQGWSDYLKFAATKKIECPVMSLYVLGIFVPCQHITFLSLISVCSLMQSVCPPLSPWKRGLLNFFQNEWRQDNLS